MRLENACVIETEFFILHLIKSQCSRKAPFYCLCNPMRLWSNAGNTLLIWDAVRLLKAVDGVLNSPLLFATFFQVLNKA